MPPESTRWVGVLLTGFFPDEAINHRAKHSARYRGDPEKPKLCDGPITNEQRDAGATRRSEEHTSELQSLMRNEYPDFCWKKKVRTSDTNTSHKYQYLSEKPQA